jgi:outer membrane receptor protein involved in Fe transport
LRLLDFSAAAFLVVLSGHTPVVGAEPEAIPEVKVTARRLPPAASDPVFAKAVLSRADLARSPGLRLDDVLRSVPGFGLFRRQSSRSAHPTTQGVTLRGLGASGAGRTLLTLDGVPQNDPFGGWIDWSRLPTSTIDTASVVRGGGAGPWGNAALAGVIALESRSMAPGAGVLELRGGQRGVAEGTLAGAFALEAVTVDAFAHAHSTDGAFVVRRDQRGSVDRKAANQGGAGGVTVSTSLADGIDAWVRGSYSEDRLVNGIDAARSRGRIGDLSLGLVRDDGDGAGWEAHAYVRDQDFRAVFVAVNPARTAATLSLDQFNVPARAAGGNVIARFALSPETRIDIGADTRFVTGDTNERFQNLGAGFTRLRKAGGDQWIAGAFAEVTYTPRAAVVMTASARADRWRQSDGARRETVIATGALARDDRFASSDGTVASFRIGARGDVDERVAVRAAAYSGFRVPTLNELYRPFRVGNDITEANPALTPERVWGSDVAVEWTLSDRARAEVVYARSWLKNSVVNITLKATPGLDSATGVVVPVGGVLRQRGNLPRAVSDAIEAEFAFDATDAVALTARYLYADPRVTRSPSQPALVGARLAQIPRHQAALGLDARLSPSLNVALSLRHVSRQFDDDLNTRVLRSADVVDARLAWRLTESVEIALAAENLFDEVVEAGRGADGLVSVGTPRTVTGGLSVGF